MNLRRHAYFALVGLRGQAVGSYYNQFLRQLREGIPPDTTERLLVQLLAHCQRSVPYYSRIIGSHNNTFEKDTEEYLRSFPILTKQMLRAHFNDLKSTDLARRKWFLNTTGGSTGEPVEFIQDFEYVSRSGAIKLLYSTLLGREIGERQVVLWGSERDIIHGREKRSSRFVNKLTNTSFVNAFRLTPETMREFIHTVNTDPPKQILAYVDAIYELARFAKQEELAIVPQAHVLTSAGTLYPFMRKMIEETFGCRVFSRYGAREVSDIACEHPGGDGFWVAPWGNYVEIVDKEGNRVPDGTEGEILVTSLMNFAMPLIRYRIGDCGILSPGRFNSGGMYGQVMKEVVGRTADIFKTKSGGHVHPGFFMVVLFFRKWVQKYQVAQKGTSQIVFKIVPCGKLPPPQEIDEITLKTRMVMGDDCQVSFEFVDDIPVTPSGKRRYTISEVDPSCSEEIVGSREVAL